MNDFDEEINALKVVLSNTKELPNVRLRMQGAAQVFERLRKVVKASKDTISEDQKQTLALFAEDIMAALNEAVE